MQLGSLILLTVAHWSWCVCMRGTRPQQPTKVIRSEMTSSLVAYLLQLFNFWTPLPPTPPFVCDMCDGIRATADCDTSISETWPDNHRKTRQRHWIRSIRWRVGATPLFLLCLGFPVIAPRARLLPRTPYQRRNRGVVSTRQWRGRRIALIVWILFMFSTCTPTCPATHVMNSVPSVDNASSASCRCSSGNLVAVLVFTSSTQCSLRHWPTCPIELYLLTMSEEVVVERVTISVASSSVCS